jgi:hypothetical protein
MVFPWKKLRKYALNITQKKDPDRTLQDEIKFVMEDDYEGISWFRNNHNPEDFHGKYVLLHAAPKETFYDRIDSAVSILIREIPTPAELSGITG